MENGPPEKKHAFAWGAGLASAVTVAAAVLLFLGIAASEGGPQTGLDHALPANLALLLISIGLTQWVWLVPLAIWSFRHGRRKFGRGVLASGLVAASLNVLFVWMFLKR